MRKTTILAKTRREGDTLTVTLPRELVEENDIHENELIEITIKKPRIDGFGALRGIGPMNPEDEPTAAPPSSSAANKPRKKPQTGKRA